MRIVTVIIAMLMLFAAPAVAVQDASSEYNSVCTSFGFPAYPATSAISFEDAYTGSDFARDFDAMLRAVATLMNTSKPPIHGEDLLNFEIANWPDT